MTVHPVMGKTPSQIGQTSLSVLSTWVQYPPPAWMTRLCLVVRLSRVMSHAHNVVRFPLFESVSRLGVGFTDHGHVVLSTSRCLFSFLASHIPCFTHIVFVLLAPPHKNKTPSQIGQTSLSLASWSPFTNMGCAAPAMDVFVSSLIARGMGVLVDVDAYHVHRSSSLVFSRLLSSSWMGSSVSVSPRECPSSYVTRTLGCSSESVPASTGQQLIHAHLLHD